MLPCADLDPTVEFFVDRLGFRLDAIFPADDPTVAVLSGHGATVRLDGSLDGDAGHLRLLLDDSGPVDPGTVMAPNGTVVDMVPADPPVEVPPVVEALVINRLHDEARWIVGRAGMCYRDLIPGRLGGSFIASHIHIPDAGPVPDYVHFHHIRFQMIFCVAGWVRLVYEDQGEPFVLEAGDCVLQPPRIRHRVLECSADLEVVEIGCPADHETIVEHTIELPTAQLRPDRGSPDSASRATERRSRRGSHGTGAVSSSAISGSARRREVLPAPGSCDPPASPRPSCSRTAPSSSSCSCSPAP